MTKRDDEKGDEEKQVEEKRDKYDSKQMEMDGKTQTDEGNSNMFFLNASALLASLFYVNIICWNMFNVIYVLLFIGPVQECQWGDINALEESQIEDSQEELTESQSKVRMLQLDVE